MADGTGADFRLTFNDKIIPAVESRRVPLLIEMARQTRNAIAIDSPHKTGHNKASMGWIPPGSGSVQGQEPSPAPNRKRATSASNVARKDAAAVMSTSGYGGLLQTGTRKMPGRPYFLTGLSKAQRSFGRIVEADQSALEAAALNPAFAALKLGW